ncbi:MAG TPA: hypothetical protein VJ837_00680, partial [Candidatus Paceibacterota bacterium]|nr:hypothetical protein [Candidatus Paceibacterota bacterium]
PHSHLLAFHQRSETLKRLLGYLVTGHIKHLALFFLDVVLDIFHQDLELGFERWGIPRQVGDLDKQILYLTMLLDVLANDLLELLVALVKKVRVEYPLFDMSVQVQLLFYLSERRCIVTVLVCPYVGEQVFDLTMIGLENRSGVGSAWFEDAGNRLKRLVRSHLCR